MADTKFTSKDDKRSRRNFTKDELLERLDYCPETGVFRWKMRVRSFGGGKMPGDAAGSKKDGYCQIKLFGRFYRAHHLAWLAITGEWPATNLDIDHKNRDRSDNSWSNLRLATRGQNNFNRDVRKIAKSGHRGVIREPGSKSKPDGRWSARIKLDGEVRHIGTYSTLEEAIAARKEAEAAHYKEFAA